MKKIVLFLCIILLGCHPVEAKPKKEGDYVNSKYNITIKDFFQKFDCKEKKENLEFVVIIMKKNTQDIVGELHLQKWAMAYAMNLGETDLIIDNVYALEIPAGKSAWGKKASDLTEIYFEENKNANTICRLKIEKKYRKYFIENINFIRK